jgi:flavin-binding protein dodecin
MLHTKLNTASSKKRLKQKLESRRLDFDAKLNRVQKTKKESTVLEEETRVAQSKYEDTMADLTEKMIEMNAKEDEQYIALMHLVDSEVKHYQAVLEVLLKLQTDLKG